MDKDEAEEAAQGTGEAETPTATTTTRSPDKQDEQASGHVGAQAETAIPVPGDKPEIGDASRPMTEAPAPSQEVRAQQGARTASVSAPAKRSHTELTDVFKAVSTKAEEPPSKAASVRRVGTRPRADVPTERRAAE
ncbi:unnamed protein product, partial [Ixodes hexagonus]